MIDWYKAPNQRSQNNTCKIDETEGIRSEEQDREDDDGTKAVAQAGCDGRHANCR